MEYFQAVGDFFGSAAISALLGALVGGVFTARVARNSHRLSIASAEIDNLRLNKNRLTLIKTEIKSAWDIFDLEYGPDLLKLPEGQGYLATWSIGSNTFVMYDTMPQCLAEVSIDLSQEVVQLYMRLKGLVAMIEENNRYAEKVNDIGIEFVNSVMEPIKKEGKEVTEEFSKKLGEAAWSMMEWEAVKIGMGNHADAMKKLALDLASTLNILLPAFDTEILKIDQRVQELQKA